MSDSDGIYRPSSKRQVIGSWVIILGAIGLFWGCSAMDDAPAPQDAPPCEAQARGGTEPC
ncbi:hypothetical protein [Streptomyces gardneri]|uniref:hypothetical protein n=1 Tax=Streptomyces gardneri TaxID=66892 RepID=UPI0035D9D433